MNSDNLGWLTRAGAAMLVGLFAIAVAYAPAGAQNRRPAQAEDGHKKPEGGPPDGRKGAAKQERHRRGAPSGAMLVRVDRVIRGPVRQTEPVIGRLVIQEGGIIAASTPGRVQRVLVQVGDRVEKGAALAQLNVDTARARLSFQRAELKLAQQELARLERLRTADSMAFAKAKYEDAVQRVARAQANVRIAEIAIRDATIRAPFPGVVIKRHTDAGAYLTVGAAVVTLINDTNLEIEADVPADRLGGLRPGVIVICEIQKQRSFPAAVRAIIPEQNALTRTVAVRLTPKFVRSSARRAVNQAVTLHVPTGKPRVAISVHKDAIVNRDGANFVYVVIDGKAVPRRVDLGESFGSRFEVLRGVVPGDLVVTRGNERLRPGQPVVIRKRS